MPDNFRPVAFESSRSRRSRRQVPTWLALLLAGAATGAIGLAVIQEHVLPPRLTADATAKLKRAYAQADAERLRLNSEFGEATKRLESAIAEKKKLGDELAASRASLERSREEVGAVIASLPPDPRGGTVEVRAAGFTFKGGVLAYNIVLTRERGAGRALAGALQLIVTGESVRGSESTITLKPVPLTLGAQDVVRGSRE